MVKEVAELELRTKADSVITEMNKVTAATSAFSKQLQDILDYLDKLDKKSLSNINTQINKTSQTLNHNIQNQNVSSYYDMGSNKKVIKGSSGAIMASDTGREKAFKDYEQAIIEETEAIRKDVDERRKRRKQRADAETLRAQNESVRASRSEDRNSAAFIADRRMIAEAKLLNAKNGQVGALLRNPRYQFGRLTETLGSKVSNVGVGADKIEGKFIGGILSTAGALLNSPLAGATTAIAKLVEGIGDLSKAAVQAYADIEATKTQLGVVFSNQTQADSMFGEISKYAVKSPFGIQQTSELAVLLKQSGVYASDLMDTLRMLGDTAGGNMEKMKRIANNYAQIIAIGKASMLDMRQFAYAGIPIFEAVSKELGVSQQQLRKLISHGKVTADIVEKVFKDLTGVNGIFENATEKGAKTLKARLQNLADAKQLALGSLGEWGVNIGAKTGNDSFVNRFVTGLENVYAWLQSHVDTTNIEKSVKVIENRDSEIKNLKELIEYIEKEGKNSELKELLPGLKANFKELLSKRDLDKERAAYENSYQSKTKEFNEFYEKGLIDNLDKLKAQLEKNIFEKGVYGIVAEGGSYNEKYDSVGPERAKKLEEAASTQITLLTNIIAAIEKSQTVNEKDKQGHRESELLKGQNLAYESVNKIAGSTESLNSKFQKLAELEENSVESQNKRLEEEKKQLVDAQKTLREISKHTDSKGGVDLKSMSRKQFEEYLRGGALTALRRLNVTEGKTAEQIGSDRNKLTENIEWYLGEIESTLYKVNSDTANSVKGYFKNLKETSDNDTFYKEFARFASFVKTKLNSNRLTNNESKEAKDLFDKVLNEYEVNLKGKEVDITNALGKNNTAYIPLWKRILSSQTGLTTQGMTATNQTMENYRNDMAIRNLASGVLKATFSSMNAETARSLMRTTGTSKVLRYDAGGNPVYQIDWAETKNAIHDFAMQLSASTEVIEAYKAGLESELNAYQELMALGFTEAESADLNQQKTVSAKKFEQFAKDAGEQLVTAFGEGLETVNGEAIGYDKKNQKFVDEKGNEIALEQVRITGNLFRFIQNEMPRLRHEIAESVSKEQNNKALSSIYSNIQATAMSQQLANRVGINKASGFALLNPDYMKAIFDSQLTSIKSTPSYNSKYGGMTNQDIHLAAMQGDSGAIALIDEVFRKIEEAAKELVNSPDFQELEKQTRNQKKQNQINAAVLKASGNGELKPDEYRGFWSHLGYDKAYTTEEVTAAYVRANPIYNYSLDGMVSKSYMGGLSEADIDKMSDKEIYEKLGLKERYEISLAINTEEAEQNMNTLKDNMGKLGVDTLGNTINSSMEILGQHLRDASDASADLGQNFASIASGLASNLGQMLTQAGLAMIIGSMGNPASPQFWAGIALAAAGSGASILAGLSKTDSSNDKTTEDKTKKLENLKNDLLDLLKQAREDAVYYENTLRHKKALSTNDSISEVKVNDAIITPKGDVISTHPDDYLIATKTPHSLLGGGSSPIVNFSLIDKSTGVTVTQQSTRYNEDSNTVEVEAVIESKVKEIIASSTSDEAFAAREARLRGRHVLM